MRPSTSPVAAFLLVLSVIGFVACARGDKADGSGQAAAALRNSGAAHIAKREYAAALRDLDQAVALKPDYASAYQTRAVAWQDSGDYARAIQDYDQVLHYKPGYPLALRGRARMNFFLGRYAAASQDLRAAQAVMARSGTPDTLDRPAAYAALWQFMADARTGHADTAALARATEHMGGRWPEPVARLYLGRASVDDVLAMAAQADTGALRDQRCAAAFYLGELAMTQKQPAKAAEHFKAARDGCPHDWTEYQGATAELGRLAPGT